MPLIVLGIILLLLLLSVLLYLMHLARVYKGSYYWPVAEGTITACKIRTYSPSDGPRQWSISLSYKYSVEGRTYRSSRIGFGSLQTSEMFALEERFKQQVPVSVYYNPKKPADSVLLPGEYQNLRVAIAIVGIVLFFIGQFVVQRFWQLYIS